MTQGKSITYIALGTAFILLIPLALQLAIGTGIDGQGFNWKLNDFVIAGVLLFGTGLAIDRAARSITNRTHRILAVTAIVLLLLYIWAELAVGIFNIPGISGS